MLPSPAEEIAAWLVSKKVNNTGENDNAGCVNNGVFEPLPVISVWTPHCWFIAKPHR